MIATFNQLAESLRIPATPRNLSVTIRTAPKVLGVSESTVKRMIRSGQVGSQRIRGRRVISYESLQSLLDS